MADLYWNSTHLAKIEERKHVAPGHHLPHKSERFPGSGLEFEDNVIQMSVFIRGNGNGSIPAGKMRKASARGE